MVRVSAGQLTHYPGDYQYYLDKSAAVSERAGLTAGVSRESVSAAGQDELRPSRDRRDQKRLEAEQRQARSRQRKAQREIVTRLENEIAELELRQTELTAGLEKSETYEKPGAALQINRDLSAVKEDLERLTGEWEQAASKLAELDAQ